MPSYLTITGFVLLASSFLLAGYFYFIHRLKRQNYLLAWAVAWLLLGAHLATGAMSSDPSGTTWDRALLAVSQVMMASSALAFYCAARLYAGLKVPVRGVAIAFVIFAAWPIARQSQVWNIPPTVLAVGFILLFVAYTFLQEGRKQESRADVLLSIAFAGWGLIYFTAAFRNFLPWAQRAGMLPLMFLPQLFTCVLMVMGVYEEERRRVERNMLALSSLNLATSSIVGGEIQKMLAQALERVLNVVRIPVGALCLQNDDGAPPTIIIAGLTDSFVNSIRA